MAVEQVTYKNIDPKVRRTIMFGLGVAMLAACFDGTIVGTIGTVLAQDLGGLDLYAWMVTAYLLCETIMIPIAGKLSDIYGRKPLFLIGLALFTVGSFVAGMSTSMEMFIVCRGIQGLGGGILIPVAMAAVADLYAPHDRAKIQGILGAIFGVGSGIGPLLGGSIEQALSWHWCFYINIPLAIVAFALTIKKFPTPLDDSNKNIDFKGIAMLTLLLVDVLLFFEFGGTEFEWISVQSLLMIVLAVVLLVIFVKVEKKAIDPILAPHLIHNKTVVMACIFMAIFGIGMMGAMMYTNMFAISVIGLTTLEAGMWSLAMVAGMMITAMSSGALLNRTGYRPWLIAGPIISFIGLYIISSITVDPLTVLTPNYVEDQYKVQFLSGMFILGIGLGCMMSIVMTAVQNSSKPSEMGMTTSSVSLIRSVGSTMGTAIFAMVINSKLSGELASLVSPSLYEMIPHGTGVLNLFGMSPDNPLYMPFMLEAGGILTAFSNSVCYAMLIGGCIILCLVVVGFIFKVKAAPVDEEFEAAKRRIEGKE